MIASAMFYNVGGQGPSPFAVHIGSLTIDLKPFVIGLQSSIIIVPVNVIIVQIFRNLRPKNENPMKKKTYEVDAEDEVSSPRVIPKHEKPPEGKLPRCFIFVAYALCYLVSAASIFFTLLYSIQWGKETSTEWVIAMVTSFFQSLLLIQPIKVVLVAVIIALFVKKSNDTDENLNATLVVRQTSSAQQSRGNAKMLEKKIQAIGEPPGIMRKYYRSVFCIWTECNYDLKIQSITVFLSEHHRFHSRHRYNPQSTKSLQMLHIVNPTLIGHSRERGKHCAPLHDSNLHLQVSEKPF